MTGTHLDGLTLVRQRLTKAYATSIMGEVRTIESVKPDDLKKYVELEIAEREIAVLAQ